MDWLGHSARHNKVFVVHGEPTSSEAFRAAVIEGNLSEETIVPALHETYHLG